MEKTIEIPFGAKDSELKGWEYTIPEGMEARIEGNKVIIEPKESEDERMKEMAIKAVHAPQAQDCIKSWGINPDDVISWLEKQGSQNLANSAKTCKDGPKFKVGDTIHEIGERHIFPMVIEEIKDGDYVCDNGSSFINIEFQDKYELVEQKPAWSEEDEEHVNSLLKRLEGLCRKEFVMTRFAVNEDEDWLKSLKERYTWKPSDEQMDALDNFIYAVNPDTKKYGKIIISLYDDLKKLKG